MIREIISIYKKSYISESEADNALVYIDGAEKYVAGKQNQIAYTMINTMNNAIELENIPAELAKIVLDNKINRDAPATYSAEDKAFYELEDQLIKTIVQYFLTGPPSKTLLEYMAMVNNAQLAQSLLNAQSLGITRIVEIQKEKELIYSTKVECENARNISSRINTDAEKQEVCASYDLLWEKENSILYLKGQNKLKDKALSYKSRIKKLPSQNSSEYNFIEQLMDNY